MRSAKHPGGTNGELGWDETQSEELRIGVRKERPQLPLDVQPVLGGVAV